ncbi:hypothetical protein ONZ45_g16463 [Pleurotus djamor]|nr:hypothetical protein ONZ45_g16463 [Pleurotus djamor]
MLASLMKAIAWGVDIHAGFNALIDHIYTHLLPAFKVALESFHRKWRYDKERGLREETQRRWYVQHNQPSNENHIAEFARKLNSFKSTSFRRSFGCLKESLPPQISFDSNGALQQPFLALSYLGFAVLDCFFRKSIDSASPLYRSSLSGGANYGMNLKQTVLCDQSLALIADKLSICDFAPDCTHQTKAQVLSAAVGQLWLDHPQTVEGTLLVPLGQLVTLGHNVICQISPWLLPKMPSQTPCSVVPPPYDNHSLSAPPIPPTNQDRPSPSLQSIASTSMSRQAKSVVSKAVKSITKPLQRITSGSTSNIASSSSDASVITSANPSAEPAIEAVSKSGLKGFIPLLKAQSRSSSSASQAESSATRRNPPADKKPVSQATLRARLMKSAQDAAETRLRDANGRFVRLAEAVEPLASDLSPPDSSSPTLQIMSDTSYSNIPSASQSPAPASGSNPTSEPPMTDSEMRALGADLRLFMRQMGAGSFNLANAPTVTQAQTPLPTVSQPQVATPPFVPPSTSNINAGMSISDHFPEIEASLVQAIGKHEFRPQQLGKLVATLTAKPSTTILAVNSEGSLSATEHAPTKDLPDFSTFIRAFGMYSLILIRHVATCGNPLVITEVSAGLITHSNTLHEYSKLYSYTAILNYHMSFHARRIPEMLKGDFSRWALEDQVILRILNHSTLAELNSKVAKDKYKGSSPGPRDVSHQTCRRFNAGFCPSPCYSNRIHRCIVCESTSHGKSTCTAASKPKAT